VQFIHFPNYGSSASAIMLFTLSLASSKNYALFNHYIFAYQDRTTSKRTHCTGRTISTIFSTTIKHFILILINNVKNTIKKVKQCPAQHLHLLIHASTKPCDQWSYTAAHATKTQTGR